MKQKGSRWLPYDEEAEDLVDLEDVPEFEHMHDSKEHVGDANEDNLEQSTLPKEPAIPDLLIDWFQWLSVLFDLWLLLNFPLNLMKT